MLIKLEAFCGAASDPAFVGSALSVAARNAVSAQTPTDNPSFKI